MFPTIVGAWVLDGGGAGRGWFCYPKGQEPRRCTGWRMLGSSSWVSSARMGLRWARAEMGMEMGDGDGRWRWEIGVEKAVTRRFQKPDSGCVATGPWIPWRW